MMSGIVVSPQIWNWYVGFFMSMGMVLSAALSCAVGLLVIDWIYSLAKKIESEPTPPSLWRSYLNLSRFQAIVIGLMLAPLGAISAYYFLFILVWTLTPNMISAPPPDSGAVPFLEDTSGMISLILAIGIVTFGIIAMIYFFLYAYAKRMSSEKATVGLVKGLLRRYFYDHLLVGSLLMLTAFPVMADFFYNIALLLVVISPSARHDLTRIKLPNAESLYIHSLEIIGSWLIVIIFIPALWLLFRGELLRWRYIIENPALNLIFRRSVKYSLFGLLGYVGCTTMHYWARSLFRLFM